MYVCDHVCTYVCTMLVYVYLCMCVYMYVCVYVHVSMYVFVHVCMYVCNRIYLCMYMRMYVCVCVCVCARTFLYRSYLQYMNKDWSRFSMQSTILNTRPYLTPRDGYHRLEGWAPIKTNYTPQQRNISSITM